MYPKAALANHPFANPHRGQHGRSGQFLGVYTRQVRGGTIRVLGPFDGSRWLPHQGKQEIARRQRQVAAQAARDAERRAEQERVKRMFDKLKLNSEYPAASLAPQIYDANLVQEISDNAQVTIRNLISDQTVVIDTKTDGIEIIPEKPIGMKVVTSDKPFGQVQDPGNPVGKQVSWTSSGVLKVGEITHIVPAGKLPSDVGAKVKDAATPRDHESFVVEARIADGPVKGKPTVYWPRTSLLQFS